MNIKRKFYKIITFVIMIIMTALVTSCSNKHMKNENDYSTLLKDYVPSESTYTFPDSELENVNVNPTFDVSKTPTNSDGKIVPYYYFRDGMCLQRDSVIKIWGKASLDTNFIAVKFRDNTYYGTVDDKNWTVYLPKMTKGGPFKMEIISDLGMVEINDVYVGEVYLLSGQSNMEYTAAWNASVVHTLYDDEQGCINEQIRLLNIVQKRQLGEPSRPQKLTSSVEWKRAEKDSIYNFSSVGFIFGKMMQKELDCPIGLVCNAVGGTIIEYWMSKNTFTNFSKEFTAFSQETNDLYTPSLGYNGVVAPLEGVVFRGVVWYQGESNALRNGGSYAGALKYLINNWRTLFNNENLTFTLCELARYNANPMAYSVMNEKIIEVSKTVKNVAVANNLDCGKWDNIHPYDKFPIGERAANETLRLFFNQERDKSPEIVKVNKISDNKVEIVLDMDVKLKNGNNGFEIKTKFGWDFSVNVSVDKNIITVSSEKDFTEIRYGYKVKGMGSDSSITNDVSKFVTVYSLNDYPMDLFDVQI